MLCFFDSISRFFAQLGSYSNVVTCVNLVSPLLLLQLLGPLIGNKHRVLGCLALVFVILKRRVAPWIGSFRKFPAVVSFKGVYGVNRTSRASNLHVRLGHCADISKLQAGVVDVI